MTDSITDEKRFWKLRWRYCLCVEN